MGGRDGRSGSFGTGIVRSNYRLIPEPHRDVAVGRDNLAHMHSASATIEPAYMRATGVDILGQPAKRLMLVLRTNGCSYSRETGGCTICGFRGHTVSQSVSREDLLCQSDLTVEWAEQEPGGFQQAGVLTPGSFLDDRQVDGVCRAALMARLASMSDVRRAVVESRAEYVTDGGLTEVRRLLRSDQVHALAVGMETPNDHVRNIVIRKSLIWGHIRKLLDVCRHCDVDSQSYLLIKPPSLSERHALDDAVSSAGHLAALADSIGVRHRIDFRPVFVARNTELERASLAGDYTPANLWTVIEVLKRTHHLGSVFVGMCDEGLSQGVVSTSCPCCSPRLRLVIERFNAE